MLDTPLCEAEVERDLCFRLEQLGFTVRQQVRFPVAARIGKRKHLVVDVVTYCYGKPTALFEVKRRSSGPYRTKQREHYEALSQALIIPFFYVAPDNIGDLPALLKSHNL